MRWLGLLLLLTGTAGLLWAADVRQADEAAVKGFTVHEWGVFRVHDDADFANADLRAQWDELPAFVYGQTTTRDWPLYLAPPMVVFKPVLFFHAPRALPVDVRVEFASGLPAVWWPATGYPAHNEGNYNFPDPTRPEKADKTARRLEWKLHLKQPLRAVQPPPEFKPLDKRHWMQTLRAVKCDEVFAPVGERSSGTTEREKFVYYDGLLPRVQALSVQIAKDTVALKNREQFAVFDIWVIDNRDVNRPRVARLPRLDVGDGARLELTAQQGERWADAAGKTLTMQLKDAGLNEDEAAALTAIWTADFFHSAGVTLFYRLPQEQYDRLLPLTVKPSPEKIVRVGLIQQVPNDPELAARVARLVKQLDDDVYARREAAQQELAQLGPVAFGYLRRLQPTVTAPEPKRRLEQLLEKLDGQRGLNQ